MNDETVLCNLNWTYGVNVDGAVVYFGPGLVPVPRDVARRKGWPSTAIGAEGTAAPDDTAVASDDVRARTAPLTADVLDAAGVPSHLLDALEIAGFVTAVSIRDASEKELTAVSGIGKVTAQKLQEAAQELLTMPDPVEDGDNA